MVTAELAACLPVLVLLLAVALSAVSVASLRVRAQDAAREAARLAARGESVSAAQRDGPAGIQVRVSVSGDDVIAVASAHAHLLLPFLPAVMVIERAAAAREPP
jgi:Flp pilus assembly protein TadG